MVLNENINKIIQAYIPSKKCKLCRKKINKLLKDSYCSSKCYLICNINDNQIVTFLLTVFYLFYVLILNFINNLILSFNIMKFLDNLLYILLALIFFIKFIICKI